MASKNDNKRYALQLDMYLWTDNDYMAKKIAQEIKTFINEKTASGEIFDNVGEAYVTKLVRLIDQ